MDDLNDLKTWIADSDSLFNTKYIHPNGDSRLLDFIVHDIGMLSFEKN